MNKDRMLCKDIVLNELNSIWDKLPDSEINKISTIVDFHKHDFYESLKQIMQCVIDKRGHYVVRSNNWKGMGISYFLDLVYEIAPMLGYKDVIRVYNGNKLSKSYKLKGLSGALVIMDTINTSQHILDNISNDDFNIYVGFA